MTDLTPIEIADAAVHFIEPVVLEELRALGRL